jgi:hypothetical protein
MRKLTLLIAGLLGSIALVLSEGPAAAAAARPLRVCANASECYTSIQAAIEAASSGDKIMIAAGTYNGSLTIGKSVSLLGAGADETAITQSGSNSVLTIGSGLMVTIEGVTVSGGQAVISAADPLGSGGGINNSGNLTLRDSRVSDNSAAGFGGGIANNSTGNLKLYGTLVSGNNVFSPGPNPAVGGGIANAGTATLYGSTVSRNGAGGFGGAGGIENVGSLTLKDSTVSGNGASIAGGGIVNTNSATLRLDASIVSGNGAGDVGGGIINYGTATLNETAVTGNVAGLSAGGIYNSGTLTLNDSTVSSNRAGVGAGGIFNSGTVTLNDSTVTGNIPDDCVGC